MNLVKAENAEEVSEADSKFTRLLSGLSELTDEPGGVILGLRDVRIRSDIGNRIAEADAAISVRFNRREQADELDQKIRQLVKKYAKKKTRIQVEGGVRRLPMEKSPTVDSLYQRVRKIGSILDVRILEEHRWSSSDICFVDDGIARIDGLGPIGGHSSSYDEFILRHSLLDRAALLALLVQDLGKKKRT
jgi:D-alanine-D-alanine ligase